MNLLIQNFKIAKPLNTKIIIHDLNKEKKHNKNKEQLFQKIHILLIKKED
jgi:hypothetical protein